MEIRGFAKNTLRSTSRFRDRQISSIRHIDIDSRGDDAAETREIVEGCPRLRSLSFLSWGWPLRREIPPGLLRLAAQFPFPSSLLPRSESLTHLELYNHGSNWPKVPPFASSFPSLTHLLMGQYTDEDTPSPEPLREVVERIMRYLTPSIHALVLRVKQSTEGYEPEVVERVVRGDADMRLLLDVQDPRPELKDGAEGWFISLPSSHHRDPERDPHLLWKEADRIIERRRQEPQALQRLGELSFCGAGTGHLFSSQQSSGRWGVALRVIADEMYERRYQGLQCGP